MSANLACSLLTVCLSVCPSVRLSVCLSVRLSVCPSVHLSICPSIYRGVTIIYADVMHEHSRKRGDARLKTHSLLSNARLRGELLD